MAEDEEVHLENSQLHYYLSSCEQFAGSYDVIKVHCDEKNEESISSTKSYNIIAPGQQYHISDQSLYSQFRKILECGLMLEEDAWYVDSLADPYRSNHRSNPCVPKTHISSSSHRNSLFFIGSVCILSSLYYTNYIQISVPGILDTMLYALWKFYKTKQEERQLKITEQFIFELHQLFYTLKKSTQLVQENELLMRGLILTTSAGRVDNCLPSNDCRWQLMHSLRLAISDTIDNIIILLTSGIKQHFHALPLTGQLNLSHNYLLDNNPLSLLKKTDDLPVSTLMHNFNIYLLLQSEFLRRFALCFYPKLWLHDSHLQLQDIGLVTKSLTVDVSKLSANLKREYESCYSYGLKVEQNNFKIPRIAWKYSDVYVAVHSAVLHLQAMLLKTRTIEELMETNYKSKREENPDDLEKMFDEVLKGIVSLDSCCKEGILQLRKLQIDKTIPEEKLASVAVENIIEEPFVKSEDYVIEDEVFEATSFDFKESEGENWNWESTTLSKEERAKREMEKLLSQRMVMELKTVLISKCTEWKERERVALLKKSGGNPAVAILEETSLPNELPCNNVEWPLPRLKTILPKKYNCRRSSLPLVSQFDADDDSDLVISTSSEHKYVPVPPPLPPHPPYLPVPSVPKNILPSNTLESQDTSVASSCTELQDTILKGAERFWSIRNQPVEDVFSGSGENLEEFGDINEEEIEGSHST